MDLKDRLFSCLLPYFNVAAGEVLNRALIETDSIFQAIKKVKLAAILPSFLKIIESLRNWRIIATALRLFVGFPGQLFQQGWAQIAAIVRQKMAESPHSLAEAALTFYITGCRIMNEDAVIPFLLEYSECPQFQLRSFFLKLSVAIASEISPPTFIERIIPATVKLGDDAVLAVRAAFLQSCGQLRDALVRIRAVDGEKWLTTAAMRLGKDRDPYLQDVWRAYLEHLKPPFSQEGCVALLDPPSGISRSIFVIQPMSEVTRHRSTGPVLARPGGMLAKGLRKSNRLMARGWAPSVSAPGRGSARHLVM
jgi:hypothetical protein